MLDWPPLIVGAVLFVAYANGANDNFKGVATLFGSGITDYRNALGWATIATAAGSVAALFLTTPLIPIFQGAGLVPWQLAESEPFVAASVLGAALTVIIATQIGMPISTTHSLTGALFGSGVVAVGLDLGFDALAINFFAPLLISPLCAVVITICGFPLLGSVLRKAGLQPDSCLCVAAESRSVVTPEDIAFLAPTRGLRVIVDREAVCAEPQFRTILGINSLKLLDASHFLSAGAVSFARGLNDTPKIVALGLFAGSLDLPSFILSVATVMALGGIFNARAVAQTVSRKITGMERDHGLWANLVTSFLVIVASKWGLPVSTTHVSCAALFGIGIMNCRAHWQMIRTILLAWVVTLPTAAVISAAIYSLLLRAA